MSKKRTLFLFDPLLKLSPFSCFKIEPKARACVTVTLTVTVAFLSQGDEGTHPLQWDKRPRYCGQSGYALALEQRRQQQQHQQPHAIQATSAGDLSAPLETQGCCIVPSPGVSTSRGAPPQFSQPQQSFSQHQELEVSATFSHDPTTANGAAAFDCLRFHPLGETEGTVAVAAGLRCGGAGLQGVVPQGVQGGVGASAMRLGDGPFHTVPASRSG